MRVAVDARELEYRPTGVGRVLQGLLESWPACDELVLFGRRPLRLPAWLEDTAHVRVQLHPGLRALPESAWQQLVLPGLVRRSGADVLLSPGYSMPLRCSVPTAVGMFDCAPFARPGDFRVRERLRWQWTARRAAERAAFLFVGTRFAAAEAVRYLRADENRIVMTTLGLTRDFLTTEPQPVAVVRQQYGIDNRTVLFVGSSFARRDLPDLERRVQMLATRIPGAHLAIAGAQVGASLPAAGNTRYLGYVPQEDLPALYACAGALAYPSRYEGFGFPVLEALACGTPVVASAVAALEETFSRYATLVDNDDDDGWVEALAEALNRARQPELQAEAVQWARRRDSTESAAQVRDGLAAALASRP